MNIPLICKIKLMLVGFFVSALNFFLLLFQKILFKGKFSNPKNILIYKIGNIGDVVCAVPAIIAIRRAYPKAEITLLTSPGAKGGLGAKELLPGAWYLDNIIIYYSEDISLFGQKLDFIKRLRKSGCDLFIQLPDDIASFRTLLRNMFFARFIGAESAFGFKIRTIQLFKKIQVDYSMQETEVESLMNLLGENGVPAKKVEYDFNVSEEGKKSVKKLITGKWRNYEDKLIVALGPGGKREGNQWSADKFAELAKYLENKYKAKIIILGGAGDLEKAEIIKSNLKSENVLIAAGKLNLLEAYELLKKCSFLVSNSTGTIHLAAAAGTPAVGLYSIRDVFGRWFPYGQKNRILYHKFLECDYGSEDCVEESIKMISIEEVKAACDLMIKPFLKI